MELLEQSDERELKWLKYISNKDALFKGKSYNIVKRLLDLSLVLAGLPAWLPLLIFCAVMIKVESPLGPVFFKQLRTGKGGRRFLMYKFRTMVRDAEDRKSKLMHLNELHWPDFKITNDPRVTCVGRLLRKSSLDELPQLFNVLRGQMSLIGPRPTSFLPNTYSLWHKERLTVPPGITGVWQIVARGSADFDHRMRLDIAYVERRCIWLDLQILVRTFISLFERRGIY